MPPASQPRTMLLVRVVKKDNKRLWKLEIVMKISKVQAKGRYILLIIAP